MKRQIYTIPRSKLNALLILGSLFSIQISLLAETVILRSHEVLHGKITYQDANILKMKDDSGKFVELQKNDILKVSYRDVKDEKEIKKIIQEEESKLPPEQRKKVVAVEKRNKYLVVGRSALIPGWGQWQTGNRWVAAFSFVAFLGAAGYATSNYGNFKSVEKDYNNKSGMIFFLTQNIPNAGIETKFLAGIVLGAQTFAPYEAAQTAGNNALQALGFVYAAQLIHSYFLGQAWEKADPNTTIGKKTAFGEWNFNAQPRQAYTPAGINRETYYEVNYIFRF